MNQSEDVEVVLGYKRRYKFHSGTLARNSTLFADMLTERNAVKLSSRARSAGIKIRWMIELTSLPSDQYPVGQLELVELTPTGERSDHRSGLIVNENGRVPQAHKVFAHYECILYAFYNKDLTIDDTDMSAALSDCYTLLQISDYLGCTSLISKPIEVALFKHGQDLFRAISSAPYAWVEMAVRIHSELIFRECIIHLVGNWKVYKKSARNISALHEIPGLRALVEKYHRQMLNQCKELELGLLALYPGKMQRPVEDLPIKREAYAKDILVWMALTFFRHWIGQRLIMEKGRHSIDCGYELYHQVGTAGEAYMDKSVINQFHTKFPMTKKALNVLENHLFEIKECMKEVVDNHKILTSNCQLDVHRFPVPYLTCTEFLKGDYPWEREVANGQRVLKPKRQYKLGGNDIAKLNLSTARKGMERILDVGDDGDDGEEDGEEIEEEGGDRRKRLRAD